MAIHYHFQNNRYHIPMKVYLDDLRPTPPGWTRTYSVEMTNTLLDSRTVTNLSLDNDLGSSDPKTEGYNVINYIEELLFNDPTFPVPEITFHSSNEGRKQLMKEALRKLERIRQQQISEY